MAYQRTFSRRIRGRRARARTVADGMRSQPARGEWRDAFDAVGWRCRLELIVQHVGESGCGTQVA